MEDRLKRTIYEHRAELLRRHIRENGKSTAGAERELGRNRSRVDRNQKAARTAGRLMPTVEEFLAAPRPPSARQGPPSRARRPTRRGNAPWSRSRRRSA